MVQLLIYVNFGSSVVYQLEECSSEANSMNYIFLMFVNLPISVSVPLPLSMLLLSDCFDKLSAVTLKNVTSCSPNDFLKSAFPAELTNVYLLRLILYLFGSLNDWV